MGIEVQLTSGNVESDINRPTFVRARDRVNYLSSNKGLLTELNMGLSWHFQFWIEFLFVYEFYLSKPPRIQTCTCNDFGH